MESKFMNKISRAFHITGLKLKAHSPEILIVGGVVGTVVSTVMACKATTKIGEILDETKENSKVINEAMESGEVNGQEYTLEDGRKDLAITYTQTGIKLAKLYGPSILLGALSITCIITSHKILTKRNVALAAAYTAIDKGFKEYRERVVDRFGEEIDHELRYNIKKREIEETITDENGKKRKIKKIVDTSDDVVPSIYAKFYDDGCTGWSKDPALNLQFLNLQQTFANKKLQEQGYLFLNDVYDMLGIMKTGAGQVVGWYYDPDDPTKQNFVDFGIYNMYNKKARDFVNGYERTILLDFNVDGEIYRLLDKKNRFEKAR